MLTKDQRLLLENIIEADNRIFDGDSIVIDMHAIVFATAAALNGTPLHSMFELPIRELDRIARSKLTAQQKRDAASIATDDFRKQVAEVLRRDKVENPKHRRHL